MALLNNRDGQPRISRRSLLVGVGVAGALTVGWQLWPRVYPPNLVAAEGETILGGYIKIGSDGHVTIACPQVELGQGAYTIVAQIVADELGADWRTIVVEPAPLNPLYANDVFAAEWHQGWLPEAMIQATGASSTIRQFEQPLREAAAAARALLCQAAAAQWDASWEACDTENGFVTRGDDRLRFGALAAKAASYSVPTDVALRRGNLSGRGVNRLDIPAKLDGSANFAGDVRLPDMVFAAIRQGPLGASRLASVQKRAVAQISGVLEVIEEERWVAVIASNWWAANRSLDRLHPHFSTAGKLPSTSAIDRALDQALGSEGINIAKAGDLPAAIKAGRAITADYQIGLAPHAALEPMTATASLDNGRLQLWIATQVPSLARRAAAQALGMSEADVDVHAMMTGGSFGRKYEIEIAGQAAILARKVKRPVQLIWSRAEDFMHDRFRPAVRARLVASIGPAGQLLGWQAKIAAPDSIAELRARITVDMPAYAVPRDTSSPQAVDGAIPPYGLSAVAIDHHPVDIGVATGKWRSGAHSYTAFFTESMIDELAKASGVEALSFRIAALADNPRLAACLTKVATKGGWRGGGPGTGQGLACHAMLGGYIAVLAEAQLTDNQRIRVTKLLCVADVGRVINPDIARQQLEGGLLFAMGAATGNKVIIKNGIAGPLRLRDLGLPRLAEMPEMSVELMVSNEAPAGVGEIGVPAVAPAIANALFASTGKRFRALPLAPNNQ